jgi:hypothetical protein
MDIKMDRKRDVTSLLDKVGPSEPSSLIGPLLPFELVVDKMPNNSRNLVDLSES